MSVFLCVCVSQEHIICFYLLSRCFTILIFYTHSNLALSSMQSNRVHHDIFTHMWNVHITFSFNVPLPYSPMSIILVHSLLCPILLPLAGIFEILALMTPFVINLISFYKSNNGSVNFIFFFIFFHLFIEENFSNNPLSLTSLVLFS